MLFLLLSIFVLCLYRIRFRLKGFNDDYLSKDTTNSIKGIFILLIVISHALPYITRCGYAYSGTGDSLLMTFFYLMSQLVVVMFLFYSGYGVGESIKSKGDSYVQAMPRHRILGTLLNFDVAVIVFIIVGILLGLSFPLEQYLLSLTGWSSVRNSNWYIFVILLCYLMNYITLRLPVSKPSCRVALLFALCAGCLLVLSFFKDNYWFNTILCYPLGFMYSTYKDSIERHLKKSYWLYASAAVLLFVLAFKLFHDCSADRFQIGYNVVSMLFAVMVVVLSLKLRINNPPLRWAGTHLFPIYIYMRLPMLFWEIKTPALVGTYPVLFILISLAVTLLIAWAYRYWEIRL